MSWLKRCRHRWEPRAVYHYSRSSRTTTHGVALGDWVPQGLFTEVLYVCMECGESRTKELKGEWDLEALLVFE